MKLHRFDAVFEPDHAVAKMAPLQCAHGHFSVFFAVFHQQYIDRLISHRLTPSQTKLKTGAFTRPHSERGRGTADIRRTPDDATTGATIAVRRSINVRAAPHPAIFSETRLKAYAHIVHAKNAFYRPRAFGD